MQKCKVIIMVKSSLIVLFILQFIYVFSQQKKPELFISSGFNYGLLSDFKNTNTIKFKARSTFNFAIGGRFYFKKNTTYLLDAGVGLSSLDPTVFLAKSNFSSNNTTATDLYSFLPPIYEFFQLYINGLKKIKVMEKLKISGNIVLGIGVKYLPNITTLDWQSIDFNGNESIANTLIFERKYKNNNLTNANRNLIATCYFGLNIQPKLFQKKWLNFELFFNPSFNGGVTAAYILDIPKQVLTGNHHFTFSNYGFKIIAHLPTIKFNK